MAAAAFPGGFSRARASFGVRGGFSTLSLTDVRGDEEVAQALHVVKNALGLTVQRVTELEREQA